MKGRNSDYTIGLEVAYLASIPQAFLSLMKMDTHADITGTHRDGVHMYHGTHRLTAAHTCPEMYPEC